MHCVIAPLECYIMQGEHPLPAPVIDKFAKTGGALTKSVFLLRELHTLPRAYIAKREWQTSRGCLLPRMVFESRVWPASMIRAHTTRIRRMFVRFILQWPFSSRPMQGFTSPYFTIHTVEKLLANTMTTSKPADQNYTSLASIKSFSTSSQLIDILISNAWPDSITGFSSAPLPTPELSSIGVDPVAEVVRRTKPRYHFAAGGGHRPRFWEREPYTWDNAEDKGRIGRFVSLGAFGGEQPSGKKPRVRLPPPPRPPPPAFSLRRRLP